MMNRLIPVLLLAFVFTFGACGGGGDAPPDDGSTDDSGATSATNPDLPFQETLSFGEVDPTLVTEGEELFTIRCTTCHKMGERYVGPQLDDVLDRRTPEWVMNMILAPDKMVVTDPEAQALLAEFAVPMTNQNLTQDEARAIVEYLRTTSTGS